VAPLGKDFVICPSWTSDNQQSSSASDTDVYVSRLPCFHCLQNSVSLDTASGLHTIKVEHLLNAQ